MMTTPLFRRRALWLALALVPAAAHASEILEELAEAQKAQVMRGTQVLVTEPVVGNVWPNVKVYRTIDAQPEEVAAVFFDYQNAKAFVPNLLKSEISQKLSPLVIDIDYGLDVPILPDEYYTVRNTLKPTKSGGYRVDWKLLRAIQTKDSVGSLRIEPFQGKSLICYQNFVTPGSSMAGLLKGRAIDQMQQTVRAIAEHVTSQKRDNPAGVKSEVESLREAIKADH